MNAVVILSGGMDSATLAYLLKADHPNNEFHYVSFDYGQRHVKELEYAIRIAEKLGGRYDVVNVQFLGKLLSGSKSVLVAHDEEVPEGHYAEATMRSTVVPNRNSIMLSIAVGIAIADGYDAVAAGMHAGDHFIYPDCRDDFIDSFRDTMRLANEGFWDGNIMTPFIDISKADIVSIGAELNMDYSMTWSCYKGGVLHCGKCGTCVERREAFSLAGVVDPTNYESS